MTAQLTVAHSGCETVGHLAVQRAVQTGLTKAASTVLTTDGSLVPLKAHLWAAPWAATWARQLVQRWADCWGEPRAVPWVRHLAARTDLSWVVYLVENSAATMVWCWADSSESLKAQQMVASSVDWRAGSKDERMECLRAVTKVSASGYSRALRSAVWWVSGSEHWTVEKKGDLTAVNSVFLWAALRAMCLAACSVVWSAWTRAECWAYC